jgi:catechol 2,3-dioxygenase-like lactoylglutathione lyase family enzyme
MDILEITLQTDNLTETEHFYSAILELETISKDRNSVSFAAGRSTLTFIQSDKLNPNYHFAFNIPKNKLEESISWITGKVDLIKNPENGIVANFEGWNAKAIYFYDNNGNILEFIARFDLDNNSEEPFSSSSILSISEIGMVTDSPMKLSDYIMEEYKLGIYEKGFRTEKFVTLGNPDGLFIIAATNRIWYPTAQPARKSFSKVRISNGDKILDLAVF